MDLRKIGEYEIKNDEYGNEYIIDRDNILVSFHLKNENVVIPMGVEIISECCFQDLPIKKVFIPSSVTKIETSAFLRCNSLEEVIFSEGLKEIEKDAFRRNYNLKKLTFPYTVEKIGSKAFGECSSLDEVIFFDNICFSKLGDRVTLNNINDSDCLGDIFYGCGSNLKFIRKTNDKELVYNRLFNRREKLCNDIEMINREIQRILDIKRDMQLELIKVDDELEKYGNTVFIRKREK